MSKILIATLLLSGFCSALNAQLALGLRGGLNYATAELEEKVNGSWDSEMQDYIFGGTAGLVAEINLGNKFALQPELNFIQKGYKLGTIEDIAEDVKTVFNYLEVPVLFKGKFGSRTVKFNAVAGPSLAYALSGKVKSDLVDVDVDFDRDEIKRWDVGAVLGIGASMDAGPGALFLDARLGWGFSNLFDSADSDEINWHNRGFNVGIGYLVALSSKK